MALCTCCIFSAMYIWCCGNVGYAVLCTYGVVGMWICSAMHIWCCVPVVHVVLCTYCTCGIVCMWCCIHVVQVVLCTRYVGGVVYMWYCVHIINVVLCIFGMVLWVLYNCCVATCVFLVLYGGYGYVLCCTLDVGVCVVMYTWCRCMCHFVH